MSRSNRYPYVDIPFHWTNRCQQICMKVHTAFKTSTIVNTTLVLIQHTKTMMFSYYFKVLSRMSECKETTNVNMLWAKKAKSNAKYALNLFLATQLFNQRQWWSKPATHLLHFSQWTEVFYTQPSHFVHLIMSLGLSIGDNLQASASERTFWPWSYDITKQQRTMFEMVIKTLRAWIMIWVWVPNVLKLITE